MSEIPPEVEARLVDRANDPADAAVQWFKDVRKRHDWDALRAFPTVRDNAHESVLRSYQVLKEVAAMLERGDSRETVLALIRFADGGYA